MKIKIVIENDNKFLEIPISKKECEAIYNGLSYPDLDFHQHLKYMKITKDFNSFLTKIEWIINDIINGGKVYTMEERKYHVDMNKDKIVRHKGGMKLMKERSYMVKKPKWKQIKKK